MFRTIGDPCRRRGSRCCRRSCCGCRRSWRGWMRCWMTRRSSRRSRRISIRCSGGRPRRSECYLRLMFLKFRYRLGYESLCAEVSDSISWRRFCRIGLDAKVPHPDDADEADHPVRGGGGGRAERGAAGQGGRAETAAHGPGAGRYHGDRRERGLPDRCGAAGQGGGQAGAGGAAGAGGGRGHRDGDDRTGGGRRAGGRGRSPASCGPRCAHPQAGSGSRSSTAATA